MPVDSLVNLYDGGMSIEAGGGLFYRQGSHRAVVFMHMDAYDQAFPIEAHEELWHPLETVLSNWINLILIGKVIGSLPGEPGLFNCEKFECWEWRPYSDAQVGTCIAAWDRLCETIEARISSSTTGSAVDNNNRHDSEPPLVPPAILDAALVPDPGFARAFLTRARRPLSAWIQTLWRRQLPPPAVGINSTSTLCMIKARCFGKLIAVVAQRSEVCVAHPVRRGGVLRQCL
ncbi:hypothetical protein MaudCBS49596_002092 [Microsporum audouinii]